MTLSIIVMCYAECYLCQVLCVLSVVNKPFMLSVVMPNVIVLTVAPPSLSLCPLKCSHK
jgi:hypothetical protein